MKKTFIIFTILYLNSIDIYAQQDPNFTQYMYNMSVVNPAYSGSKESISGGLLYRQQWVGIPGAPQTGTLSVHSPVGKNLGLGLSVISDKIGPVEENNIYADISYTLKLKDAHRLAFGVKMGATFNKIGLFSEIGNGFTTNPNDIAFSENSNSSFMNLGLGLFYYTDKYYAAFSIPNILKSTYLEIERNNQQYKFGTETKHYFLTAGYVFDISENTKFKPSFMLKSAIGVPASFDLSSNFLMYDKLEIGGTYRFGDSVGALINYPVTSSIRIGYAYDHIISPLNISTQASHEVMFLFDLNLNKKVSISPRFF